MTFETLRHLFNRAFWHSFSRKKLTFVFAVLAICGLLVVFCRALSLHAGSWISMSLTFLPIFVCTGILLATGVVLIRLYHDEIKKGEGKFKETLAKSWQLMIGTSYLSLPLLLGYLLLWIMLGIFYLLKEIPAIGLLISVVFAFGPFLLILGSLLLGVLNLGLLFFATPIVALRGHDRTRLAQLIIERLKHDLLGNLVLILIALLPILLIIGLLMLSALLTEGSSMLAQEPLYIALQWFFIMLPFAACLSPLIVFFFNFAAEAHVLMQKHQLK